MIVATSSFAPPPRIVLAAPEEKLVPQLGTLLVRKIRLSPEEYDRYLAEARRTAIEERAPTVYDAFLERYERYEGPRFYNPSASRAPGPPPKLTAHDVWAAQQAALDTIYSPRPR